METEAWIVRTWDDLVFRNRNRAYGAYPLRRAYSRRVLLGAGFSAAVMAGFLVFSGIASDVAKVVIPPVVPIWEGGLLPPPVVEPEVKPPPRRTDELPKSTNTNTTVRVVTDEVETTTIESTDNSSLTGTDEMIGSIDGTGASIELMPSPAVIEPPKGPLNFAEVMPRYDGGLEAMMKFIKKKINYPASARSIGIEGTVYVSFVVNGDGTVTDVAVLRGIHRKCDEEAVRVVSLLPDWIGGKQNGNPVAVRMVLPIKFTLD